MIKINKHGYDPHTSKFFPRRLMEVKINSSLIKFIPVWYI